MDASVDGIPLLPRGWEALSHSRKPFGSPARTSLGRARLLCSLDGGIDSSSHYELHHIRSNIRGIRCQHAQPRSPAKVTPQSPRTRHSLGSGLPTLERRSRTTATSHVTTQDHYRTRLGAKRPAGVAEAIHCLRPEPVAQAGAELHHPQKDLHVKHTRRKSKRPIGRKASTEHAASTITPLDGSSGSAQSVPFHPVMPVFRHRAPRRSGNLIPVPRTPTERLIQDSALAEYLPTPRQSPTKTHSRGLEAASHCCLFTLRHEDRQRQTLPVERQTRVRTSAHSGVN